MSQGKHDIVVVKCQTCGVEIVGRLRNGRVYAVNSVRPESPRVIAGYCAAHALLDVR